MRIHMRLNRIMELLEYEKAIVGVDDEELDEMYGLAIGIVGLCRAVTPKQVDLPELKGAYCCPDCDKFLTRDMRFCYNCGHPLDWDGVNGNEE